MEPPDQHIQLQDTNAISEFDLCLSVTEFKERQRQGIMNPNLTHEEFETLTKFRVHVPDRLRCLKCRQADRVNQYGYSLLFGYGNPCYVAVNQEKHLRV